MVELTTIGSDSELCQTRLLLSRPLKAFWTLLEQQKVGDKSDAMSIMHVELKRKRTEKES